MPKTTTTIKTVNQKLFDEGVRHSVLLERLKVGEANKVVNFMKNKVQPDLIKQIESKLPSAKKSTDGLRRLVKANDGFLRGSYGVMGKQLKKSLTGIAVTEARFAASMLKEAMPLQFGFEVPSINVLRDLVTKSPIRGAFLPEWVQNASRRDITRVNSALRMGIAQGEGTAQIISRVKEAGKMANREAQSLVRTAVNNVVTQSKEQTYLENDDVIKEVQYVATLDARTTEICASLDGQTYPINEGPRPPQHFNCRSTTVPVTKSWKELGIDLKKAPEGTRASMDGQVAEKTTFGPWLKKQPKGVQNQVLGVQKAAIFRRGNLNITQFTNKNLKPLTVSQLKKLEQKNLEKVGAIGKAPNKIPGIKPETIEDFQYRWDHPELKKAWMIKAEKAFFSGNPLPWSGAKLVDRHKLYWKFLKDKPAPTNNPLTGKKLKKSVKKDAGEVYSTSLSSAKKPVSTGVHHSKLQIDGIEDNLIKNKLNVQFDKLEKMYPAGAQNITKVQYQTASNYKATWGPGSGSSFANAGQVNYSQQPISLNGKYFDWSHAELKAKLKALKKQKFLAGSKVEDLLTHEFGHALRKSFDEQTKGALEKYFASKKWVSPTKASSIQKSISEYGFTNASEMFSEAFVKFVNGKSNAVIDEIMIMVKLKKAPGLKLKGYDDLQGFKSSAGTKLPKGGDIVVKGLKPDKTWSLKNIAEDERNALNRWLGSSRPLQTAELEGSLRGTVFNNGLNKLPQHSGVTYRGGSFSKSDPFGSDLYKVKEKPGSIVTTKNSLSSSKSKSKAVDFESGGSSEYGGEGFLLEIHGKTGADMHKYGQKTGSMYTDEREVVVRLGKRFKVISAEHKVYSKYSNSWHIVLKEL